MATVTAHRQMRAVQQESGLCVVVELPGFPADRVVAAGAVAVESASMWILCSMAVHTGIGCIPEYM